VFAAHPLEQCGRRTIEHTDDHEIHPLVRLSPHFYNTEVEIDRAIGSVAAFLANRG
jgi:selenocysteine lyase/cysteine desulfurase